MLYETAWGFGQISPIIPRERGKFGSANAHTVHTLLEI